MRQKKITFFILNLLLISSILINAQSKAKYLFKIATEAPDNSTWINSIKSINTELSKKTYGQIEISVYPGGVMGDQSTVLKKIKIGQLTGATFTSLGLSYIYKDFSVLGLPLLYNNYAEYDYVIAKLSNLLDKEFEKGGFIILAWTEVGLIYTYSKKQVNSIDTLKKSKPLLIADDTMSQYLFDEIGVKPIPLQISDVMTGLQTGSIDTIFSSHYGVIAMQWSSRVKYMADYPLTLMTGAVVVEKNLFNSMPASYKAEMKNLFKIHFEKLNQKVRKDNEYALELLKRNGNIIVLPVEEKEKRRFIDVCTKVAYNVTEKEYSRDLYIKIINLLKEYRANKK
ncbi:MAG: TRAP transporter substrate-binding protein DctP [Spirochaetes bacterium]|nr:TRAP transporter substrate-binding protein DctP [Spirochaetota bacterium]